MTFERMQRLAFRAVSQTAIAYRKSALSKSLERLARRRAASRRSLSRGCGSSSAPTVRSRICSEKFDDLGFDLFLFGQSLPAGAGAFGALVRVHAIPADPANDAALARAGIPQPSFYLVRPDGHVGLCGGRLDADAMRRYFSEALRLG